MSSSLKAPFIRRPYLSDRGFSLSWPNAALLAALLAFGFTLLGSSVDIASINTLLIFLFVTVAGLWLCNRTRRALADPKLKILSTFWLIKIAATLFLLYVGWLPQLDSASASWGYDPQRYFQNSWYLIENDWNPVVGQNYQGIIFYYAAMFYLFGHNPVIPALLNAFVTMLGTIFLISCAYEFAPSRTTKDWSIAALLLVPEVLWYDVMTSRETLMAILIIIAVLEAGRYMVGGGRISPMITLMLSGTAMVAILAVRTIMIIPVIVIIFVMALTLKSRRPMGLLIKIFLGALGVGAFSAGPLIQQFTGGYDIDYIRMLTRIQSLADNIAAKSGWSDNSIGFLIAPNDAWQAIAFLPPRMLLYLVAPLPNITVSVSDLIGGSWSAWQQLMTFPTSAIILLGFHYVLAATAQAWHLRTQFPATMIIPIAFWITFAAVAGGNIIIHERYRLMCTLLLFACIWWGYTRCRKREVMFWALPWFGLLLIGAIFYISYKLMG